MTPFRTTLLAAAFISISSVALAQTPLTAHPVGLNPSNPTLEQIWAATFAKIRQPAGPTNSIWDQPPANNAITFNAALQIDDHTMVGVSALFSSGIGCDMGPNGKNAVEQPVICPGKIALFRDQNIVAVADIPKVCISSLMKDGDPSYQTIAMLSSDRRQVFIAGTKNNVPLAGDFSGVKDCTVAVPIPR